MIQISEPDDSESLNKNIPIINYRFNRKFDFFNCHSQLYIADSKLKIIINCIDDYSKEIKSYSNLFSIFDLQKISKYYKFFNKIDEILEDLANIFNQGNYDIERSGSKLYLILHLDINEEIFDVKLKLEKSKINNMDEMNKMKNKKILNYKPKKNEEIEDYQRTKNSSNNVGVKSMNELNYVLTDLKDRLTVLEVTKNTNNNHPRSELNKSNNRNNILNTGNSSIMNENILLNLELISKRIDKLEAENNKKNERINTLKEKINEKINALKEKGIFEPSITATSDIESLNDNNIYNINNNYNYNNINYNNMNQNINYKDLGSIKNVDTSTILSTNSNMKNDQI